MQVKNREKKCAASVEVTFLVWWATHRVRLTYRGLAFSSNARNGQRVTQIYRWNLVCRVPFERKKNKYKANKTQKNNRGLLSVFFLFLLKWGKKYIRRRNGIKRHSWNICLRGVGYRTIFTVNVILILFKSLVGKLVWNFLKMNLWRISSLSYSSKKKLLLFFPLRFDCQVKRDQRQTIHPCFVVAVAVVAFFS